MKYAQLIPVTGVVAVYRNDDGSEFRAVLPLVGLTEAGYAYALDLDHEGRAVRPNYWPNFVRVDTELA